MNDQVPNLRELLEQKITHGDITKRARWYFIIRRLIIGVATILALLLAIYFGSFILFVFNDQGIGLLAEFGWEGGWELLNSLPWIIIALIILLILTIELVGWRFTRLYRQPLVYSILGTLVIILIAGILIERTHLHRTLADSAEKNNLPVAGYLYHHFARPLPSKVHFGIVLDQEPEKWQVETREGTVMVIITTSTRFPRGADIGLRDHVLIFGPLKNGIITARGIRKINPDMMPRLYLKMMR